MRREKSNRVSPRISVNKLGEYLVAKAGRRLTIISDQKHPRDFIVARYSVVFDSVARCLAAGGDPRIIRETMERLYDLTPKGMWHQQDIELSVEALDLFLNLIDDINFSGYDVIRAGNEAADMVVDKVTISVKPNLYLCDKQTKACRGVVKLSILKAHKPKDDDTQNTEAALYVGTVLHQYANEVLSPKEKIAPLNCLVIDVFGQRVLRAPKSFTKRRTNITAACREIARGWSEA